MSAAPIGSSTNESYHALTFADGLLMDGFFRLLFFRIFPDFPASLFPAFLLIWHYERGLFRLSRVHVAWVYGSEACKLVWMFCPVSPARETRRGCGESCTVGVFAAKPLARSRRTNIMHAVCTVRQSPSMRYHSHCGAARDSATTSRPLSCAATYTAPKPAPQRIDASPAATASAARPVRLRDDRATAGSGGPQGAPSCGGEVWEVRLGCTGCF